MTDKPQTPDLTITRAQFISCQKLRAKVLFWQGLSRLDKCAISGSGAALN
jgi:hypothetical protein